MPIIRRRDVQLVAVFQADRQALAVNAFKLQSIEPVLQRAIIAAQSHPWRVDEAMQSQLAASWIVQTLYMSVEAILGVVAEPTSRGEVVKSTAAAVVQSLIGLGLEWMRYFEAAYSQGKMVSAAMPADLLADISGTYPSADLAPVLAALVPAVKAQVELAMAESTRLEYKLPREFRHWREAFDEGWRQLELQFDQPNQTNDQSLQLSRQLFRFGQQVFRPRLLRSEFTVQSTTPIVTTPEASLSEPSARTPYQGRLGSLTQWLGFTPWLVTAPERRTTSEQDLQRLDEYWRQFYRPQDAEQLMQMLRQIEAECMAQRIIRQVDNGKPVVLRDCPWSPVYIATERINLGENVPGGSIFAIYPHLVDGQITHIRHLGRDPRYIPAPAPDPATEALWVLTAPTVRSQRAGQESAKRALKELWQADDDPATTARLIQKMQQAETEGKIQRLDDYLEDCPWPSIFLARERIGIGENIPAGTRFALTARLQRGQFTRFIVRLP